MNNLIFFKKKKNLIYQSIRKNKVVRAWQKKPASTC